MALLTVPIFSMLHLLQGVILSEPQPVLQNVSPPMDYVFEPGLKNMSMLKHLLSQGSKTRKLLERAFWKNRQDDLRNAVLGLDWDRTPRSLNVKIDGDHLLVRWNLSRFTSTAVLTRPVNQTPHGLVIYHAGHDQDFSLAHAKLDPWGTAHFLADLGFDVL